MFNLRNKTVLVTGATGYLGKAICKGLFDNGANIAICSTNRKKALELSKKFNGKNSSKHKGYELNIEYESGIEELVNNVINDFGQIDCLVNNAFYSGECDFNNFSKSSLERGLDGTINQVSTLVYKCTETLKKSKGNIINIASMYGMLSPDPDIYNNRKPSFLDYALGKSAIIHYTKYAAVHLAKKNIRVNTISPGPFPNIETQKDKTFIKKLKKKVPLGRIGNPSEIAGSVVFLASDSASYITGHNLVVDGGWTIW